MLTRKHMFSLPEGVIYLDGNSLGVLPKGASARANEVIENEWGQSLIRAWNDHDWIGLPMRVGDKIAKLIGAPKGSVATGDTLSIKVYQALAAAIEMVPERRVVLSDSGNFPTDLYMSKALLDRLGGYELRIVEPEQVESAIDGNVAAVLLTHVDYRSGRLHDMEKITRRAHQHGAVMIWDLAHSAGALALEMEAVGAEFAVGCSYKYLNGGPGAPAFIYTRPDIIDKVSPMLAGWMGHAAPFEMALDYRPAAGASRMRIGTPPIIQLAILDVALDVWEGVDMNELRAASIALSTRFMSEIKARCPMLELASPERAEARGSQISFRFEHGYEAMQACIAEGVIGDFRAPNIMRFGFTPLYVDENDVVEAAKRIEKVMREELWRAPKFQMRGKVT